MNVRSDIVKMYIEVHSWVGILSGLCLFIAFYAGAITMFERPLERWASPPIDLPPPISLKRAPELVDKLIAAHPEAANNYAVTIRIDGYRPARVSWRMPGPGGRPFGGPTSYAALDASGALRVSRQEPSPVAEFINMLHQKVGLPLPRGVALRIMGVVALLYCIAIASGIVVLLPSLVKDLFALRLGKNLKRMWLDVHNVLGLFSLPFHIVMAVTSVGFAFFPYFYQSQVAAFGYRMIRDEHAVHGAGPVMAPATLVAQVEGRAPGFRVAEVRYTRQKDGSLETHVSGPYPGQAVRGASEATVEVDAYTGAFTDADFFPKLRDYAGGFASNFVGSHFGNFGGDPLRWAYFLLGLAGAALFYTGNLLWIESRRKKERGLPQPSRSTRILGALTVGVPLGCIAGVSSTIAAAKLLGTAATPGWHSAIYHAAFFAFTAHALIRGAARSGSELAGAAAVATLIVPFASLLTGKEWYAAGASILVDLSAVAIAAALLVAMGSARRRAKSTPHESIWASA